MSYSDPNVGCLSTLKRVSHWNNVPVVQNAYETKNILAANVEALMAQSLNLTSNILVETHSKGTVKKSTLQRIRAKKSACDIATLANLAKVFELAPWQLLLPELNVSNPQTLREATPVEAAMYAKFREMIDLAKQTKPP